MTSKVLFSNYPGGTTVEDLQAELETFGVPVLHIEKVDKGDPERLTFVVKLDVDHHTAQMMAERSRARYYKDRRIDVYVPTLMED